MALLLVPISYSLVKAVKRKQGTTLIIEFFFFGHLKFWGVYILQQNYLKIFNFFIKWIEIPKLSNDQKIGMCLYLHYMDGASSTYFFFDQFWSFLKGRRFFLYSYSVHRTKKVWEQKNTKTFIMRQST